MTVDICGNEPPPPPGFPNAATTGLIGPLNNSPPGNIAAGGTYEDIDFTSYGTVDISVPNTTFRNCLFHVERVIGGAPYSCIVRDGANGTLFEDCEFTGSQSAAFFGQGLNGVSATLRRCHIHDTANDGMKATRGISFFDCFVEKISRGPFGGTADSDSLQMSGNGGDILISHCAFDNSDQGGFSNACLQIKSTFGPITNFIAENSLFIGGSSRAMNYQAVNGFAITNSRFSGNTWAPGNQGLINVTGVCNTGFIWENNVLLSGGPLASPC